MNLTSALGWTLLHFVWEGALIAILLAIALTLLRGASAQFRYAASCVAMMLMITCAAATFLEFRLTGNAPAHHSSLSIPLASTTMLVSGRPIVTTTITDYFPELVWVWIGGVIALSIRSLGGWAVAERFTRRYTEPAPVFWQEKFATLKNV